jgi:hypothetical protein
VELSARVGDVEKSAHRELPSANPVDAVVSDSTSMHGHYVTTSTRYNILALSPLPYERAPKSFVLSEQNVRLRRGHERRPLVLLLRGKTVAPPRLVVPVPSLVLEDRFFAAQIYAVDRLRWKTVALASVIMRLSSASTFSRL